MIMVVFMRIKICGWTIAQTNDQARLNPSRATVSSDLARSIVVPTMSLAMIRQCHVLVPPCGRQDSSRVYSLNRSTFVISE